MSVAPAHGASSRRALRVSRLTTVEAMSEIADEWGALFARIEDTHPSTSHAWVVAWKEYLERGVGPVRSTLCVYAVRDQDDALVAVVPAASIAVVVLGVRIAHLLSIGMASHYVEPCTLLVAPEDEPDVVRLLADAIGAPEYDLVLWSGLRVPGEAMTELLKRPRALEDFGFSHLVVRLPATWQEMESGLSRYTRRTVRRNYNALRAEGHQFTLEVLDKPAAVISALDVFFALHLARPDLQGKNSEYRRLTTPRARDFLRSLIGALAPLGVVRVFQLCVDGKVVAMRLGVAYRGGIYLYLFADDPEWKKYGVLTTNMAELFKHAIANEYRFVYLSTVRRYSNMRWLPQETPVGQVVVWNATPRAVLLRAARAARRAVLRFIRDTKFLIAETFK